MEKIHIERFFHRQKRCIGITFGYDQAFLSCLRQIARMWWSKTHRCWYMEDTAEHAAALHRLLIDKGLMPAAEKFKNALPASESASSATAGQGKSGTDSSEENPVNLTAANNDALDRFHQQLILKGYSRNTMRTYLGEFRQFLQMVNPHAAEDFKADRMRDYLQYCLEVLKLSENTVHSRMNALKFYYESVLGKEKFFFTIPRPKKPLQLPKTISKEQVAAIINAIPNLKHRTLVALTYACGLRVSEAVSLRIRNIDSKRMILFIESGKGKKDRVVSLSPSLLLLLRAYYKKYTPKDFLFEGQMPGTHMSTRSIQIVLQSAKKKAGVQQAGNMHMLRHSFATHLLDKGIDVVFIQKMLGHNDIKTTLRYLHVTNKDISGIISPFEDLEGLIDKL